MHYHKDKWKNFGKDSSHGYSRHHSSHSSDYSSSRHERNDEHVRHRQNDRSYHSHRSQSSYFPSHQPSSHDQHSRWSRSDDSRHSSDHHRHPREESSHAQTLCIFEWMVLKDPDLAKDASSLEYLYADSLKNTFEHPDPRRQEDYSATDCIQLLHTVFDIDESSNPLNLPPCVLFCEGLPLYLSKVQIYTLFEDAFSSFSKPVNGQSFVERVEPLLHPGSLSFLGAAGVCCRSPVSSAALRHIHRRISHGRSPDFFVCYDRNGRIFERRLRGLQESRSASNLNLSPKHSSQKSLYFADSASKAVTADLPHSSGHRSLNSPPVMPSGRCDTQHFCLKIEPFNRSFDAEVRSLLEPFQVVHFFRVGRTCWAEFENDSVCSAALSAVQGDFLSRFNISVTKVMLSHSIFGNLLKNSQQTTLEISRDLISCEEFSKISEEISTLSYTPDFCASPKTHRLDSRFVVEDDEYEFESGSNSDSVSASYESNVTEVEDDEYSDSLLSHQDSFAVVHRNTSAPKRRLARKTLSGSEDKIVVLEPIECSRITSFAELKRVFSTSLSSRRTLKVDCDRSAKVRTHRASVRNLKSLIPEMEVSMLSARTKKLKLDKSGIHALGIFALENIDKNDFVIEYVGEVIRDKIAELRETYIYAHMRDSSSYLFRIDHENVVDATFKGNLARFMNHSCDPSCTAKILDINGKKKICVYAKRDISIGDEITYDYKFPIEDEKIPCLCGSSNCRGTLN